MNDGRIHMGHKGGTDGHAWRLLVSEIEATEEAIAEACHRDDDEAWLAIPALTQRLDACRARLKRL